MAHPVVICPLDVERRAAVKAVGDRADVIMCGPGGEAVSRCMAQIAARRPSIVVLFGLAGGLREGSIAPRITRVMDRDAHTWIPSAWPPIGGEEAALVGVDEPVLHPARKKQMGQAYGAALVDCESHVFAELACAANLRWAVVRGVCDGVDVQLPAHASTWVDASGRTRIGSLILSMVLNPSVLPAAIGLGRRARPALKAAAGRLLELLSAEQIRSSSPEVMIRAAGDSKPAVAASSNPIEAQLGRASRRSGRT